MRSLQNTKRKGFTLIELLLVVVILASIATMVVSTLSFAEDRAKSAVTGSTIGQVTSTIETYKTSTGTFPLGMDTLLEGDGGTPSSTGVGIYSNLWGHGFSFGGGFGPAYDLTMTSFDAIEVSKPGSWTSSIAHVFSPNSDDEVYFYNHDAGSTDYENSATEKMVVTDWGATNFAFVSNKTGTLAARLGYPNGIPNDVEIIVFGIGNQSSLREIMANAPIHSESDSNEYYTRYLAYYAVYQNGKQAKLKAVLDSYGVDAEGNVEDYEEAAPDHE